MSVPTTHKHRPTRRTLLRAGLAWAAMPCIRATARGHEADRTIVLLHLSGGNDGLNTLIPLNDPLYHDLRPRLSRVAENAIAIGEGVGLHPSLAAVVPIFRQGHLAIIQGVGCPCPDYSHAGSCRTWWSDVAEGLYGRCGLRVADLGDAQPGRSPTTPNPLPYRSETIVRTLQEAARVASSIRAPEVVHACVGGFDTHEDQLTRQAEVLRELADGLAAFQREVDRRGASQRVILIAWSEFGRRPAENAAGGTDHGAAGLLLAMGRPVRGGLHGRRPSLRDMDFGNLVPTADVRTIHAALAERWLGQRVSLRHPTEPPWLETTA